MIDSANIPWERGRGGYDGGPLGPGLVRIRTGRGQAVRRRNPGENSEEKDLAGVAAEGVRQANLSVDSQTWCVDGS